MEQLAEASEKHPYCCATVNFYSNDAGSEWTTWAEFYDEYHDADIDLNLVFRFDVEKYDKQNAYSMNLFMIHQGKGIFAPHCIRYVHPDDHQTVTEFLNRHMSKLKELWQPFTL